MLRNSLLPALALPFVLACATAKQSADATAHNHVATPAAAGTPTATASAPATSAAPVDHQHMAGMAGMSMPAVSVPSGALYTVADVQFMQGMIAHHAQAIYMSRLAETRGTSQRVMRFAKKIDQSQAAEIRLMQEWLIANKQSAPDTNSFRTMTMAGMLTNAQLAQLEATKGPEFDRQFLILMIKHHEGALQMVASLMASPRAAQDVDISVFANDVEVVQTAEIALMHQMLADL